MNPLLLSKKWCNLVFEGRNKDYGAYQLRRDEGKYLLRALIIVVGIFLSLIFLPLIVLKWQGYVAERNADDAIANFSKLKEPELKKNHELKVVDVAQKVNVKKVKNAIKFVPEISPDEKVESQLILGTDETGTTESGQVAVAVPDSTLMTDADVPTDDPGISTKYSSPVEVVEQMPLFPGGLKALMEWLTKNLKYPPLCMRDNIQGRVEVSFYVDKNGNIKEPQVTKKVHPLLDREALLTVKRMPKWQPGKVKGKVSIVRVTIPVEFCL